ncbi:hypothetical protein B0H14DRAFT_3857997 [Mycena olivaceomarginata]|nr:hypothetical protein B0H14DRAFT_3857997 [Mycena olivaceomarginata]
MKQRTIHTRSLYSIKPPVAPPKPIPTSLHLHRLRLPPQEQAPRSRPTPASPRRCHSGLASYFPFPHFHSDPALPHSPHSHSSNPRVRSPGLRPHQRPIDGHAIPPMPPTLLAPSGVDPGLPSPPPRLTVLLPLLLLRTLRASPGRDEGQKGMGRASTQQPDVRADLPICRLPQVTACVCQHYASFPRTARSLVIETLMPVG